MPFDLIYMCHIALKENTKVRARFRDLASEITDYLKMKVFGISITKKQDNVVHQALCKLYENTEKRLEITYESKIQLQMLYHLLQEKSIELD